MASGLDFPTFFDRFEDLRRRLRRHLGWQTLSLLAICGLLGLVAMAGLDYRLELPWLVRAIALGVIVTSGVLLSAGLLVVGLRSWTRYRTASVIENKFPELGQRVRTTIEHRGRSADQLKQLGVAPGLVRALETEAAVSTLPLPLENLIPIRRLIALSVVTAMIAGFVAGIGLWHGDWQTAIRRSLLVDEPFTHLSIGTTDSVVDRGSAIVLTAVIKGRVRDTVVLRTRPIDRTNTIREATAANAGDCGRNVIKARSEEGGPWNTEIFALKDADLISQRELAYESSISNITEPFEFQWVAGPEKSAVYCVDVRYPLQISSVSVNVTPPSYTGLPTSESADGNLNALEGSHANFKIELDGIPATARILLNSTATSKGEEVEPQVIDAIIEGNFLRFETTLTSDVNWSIEAESAHGLPLSKNAYRIRVRKDGPPTVAFEEPNESLDVHSLAEILMRIRARDDFGLTRAGIVFQVNNDEEHTLFAEDFQQSVDELNSTGRITTQTNAAIERTLPLEHFKLIQKDAISYYGFAEDNRPGAHQRTETELRFIDIRPFKTVYRQPPPRDGDDMPTPDGPRRATFEELIGRQRTALNRTVVMKRNAKQDLGAIDRLMKYESEIAELTNGLARFLQAQATQFDIQGLFDNADLLFQAERAMLDSVDSMSVGKYDVAMLQEKDAVRFLVESRDRLEVILENSKNPSLEKALGDFFKQQQTKLRNKPNKDKDEQEKAEELLARLAQLASQQAMVAAELDSSGRGRTGGTSAEETGEATGATTDDGTANSDPNTDTQANSNTPQNIADPNAESGNSVVTEEKRRFSVGMSREEILKKQQEIAGDAAEVQQELGKLREATDLAKRRMASALEAAESASSSLNRGNSKDAVKSANDAADKFDQLLMLAQGLLAPELSDQLNVARDMADDLSRQEEDLAETQGTKSSTGLPLQSAPETAENDGSRPGTNERREAIAKRAERLATQGESLADILSSTTKSTSPNEQKTVSQIAELLDKGGLANAIERMQQQPDGIRAGQLEDEKKAATEIAERLDDAARKLDTLKQEIVNPRVAELMQLEAKAEKLSSALDDIETGRQSEQWLQAADRFLEELEFADGDLESEDELKEEMKGSGWNDSSKRLRGSGSVRDEMKKYKTSLRNIANELRDRVQQLLLAELTTSGEEALPAQYDSLVSRYQKVLTMGPKGSETRASKAKSRRAK